MSEQFDLVDVVDVVPLEGLWIRVTFDDGAVMDIGLENVLRPLGVFAPVVEDREFFEQVQVDPAKGVVEWPGELDLDSEAMYGKVKPIGPDYERRMVRPPAPSAA
jgi:Protein of unknown function (DUF2442)